MGKASLDLDHKIEILGNGARFDLCGSCGGEESRKRHPQGGWIYPVSLPGSGRKVNILKILLSNDCMHNCLYCANREGRDHPVTSFSAEELSSLFWHLYQKGMVKGLFLSSAVDRSPSWTMNEMLKVAEILRYRLHFSGYLHLKILPDVSNDYLEEAVKLATRVSVNLEAPTPQSLHQIAPQKNFSGIWRKFEWFKSRKEKGISAPAGVTTQLVVGGGKETDREIIYTASQLYERFSLARVYYSAFQPVADTPLSYQPPVSTWREHRLYQADFLLRRYNFSFEELIFDEEGNFPLSLDPKALWAHNHPEFFPVEINSAPWEVLIRVPGIGTTSARRIINLRRKSAFRDPKALSRLGVRTDKALPFILLNGKKVKRAEQLSLFT